MYRIGNHGRCLVTALLTCWLGGAGPEAMAAVPHADPAPLIIAVTNPLDMTRNNEVLSLPLVQVWQRRPAWKSRALAVREAGHADRLPTQRYASDGGAAPDRLLVRLDIAPHATIRLKIQPASSPYTPKANLLYARHVPERADDFAWENGLVAFRIYGKALEADGGLVSSGIDVWSKRPPHHVIDEWYRRDALGQHLGDPTLSYHIDHGDGLDSYNVGHSPGDGGTAIWLHGAPVYSHNAAHVRITAQGPVRLRFEVDYAPWQAGKAVVREHKVVTLDAGSRFNRQTVKYRITGAHQLTVAAGVAVHAGAKLAHAGAGRIAVWDTPQRKSAGRIATGLVLPQGESARFAVGGDAAWMLFQVTDADTISFASGAGWSKGDMPDFRTWLRCLRDYRMRWSHPLQVRWPAAK